MRIIAPMMILLMMMSTLTGCISQEPNVENTEELNEDFDNDGITDFEEQEIGTYWFDNDSDDDGLNDGIEVEIGTDPLNPDSDGDGFLDGEDILPKYNFVLSFSWYGKDVEYNGRCHSGDQGGGAQKISIGNLDTGLKLTQNGWTDNGGDYGANIGDPVSGDYIMDVPDEIYVNYDSYIMPIRVRADFYDCSPVGDYTVIDLGGIDGLLHITDLSWGRVNHPSEITSIGETINVKIIEVDSVKQRISLGLKQLVPHPWDNVEDKFPIGSKIKGKIVSLTNYGAFVELDTGVEGLVHVSEMSWTRNIRRPDEVVQLGQEVEAQVLSIDLSERKIALGFKQLKQDPWQDVQDKYEVDSILKGEVRNLTQFGAFVELQDGIDGLIHVSDLSWTKVINHPKEILKKGEMVEVKVLEVSKENHRIALSLKQMTDDPWETIKSNFSIGKEIKGKVIKNLEKGIILDLVLNTEGIIKSDNFSKENKTIIENSIKNGQILDCKVLDINQEDKKIILSFLDEKKLIESFSNNVDNVSKEK